jgi:metacaspase-1
MEIIKKRDACQNKRLSVHIGINYTGTSNALAGCINDVKRLQAVLQQRFGITDSIVLTDDKTDAKLLPTKANILRVLKEVAQRTKTDGVELVVIQYSGHGTLVPYNPVIHHWSEYEHAEQMNSAWVLQDMNVLCDNELRHIINQFSPWCRVFCLSDSCHSGTGLDLPLHWKVSTPGVVVKEDTTAPVCDILYISGCGDAQKSADTQAGGALTIAFCETMFQAADVFSLMDRMESYMKAKNYTQQPQLSSSRPIAPGTPLANWLR